MGKAIVVETLAKLGMAEEARRFAARIADRIQFSQDRIAFALGDKRRAFRLLRASDDGERWLYLFTEMESAAKAGSVSGVRRIGKRAASLLKGPGDRAAFAVFADLETGLIALRSPPPPRRWPLVSRRNDTQATFQSLQALPERTSTASLGADLRYAYLISIAERLYSAC
jgi:hypothetical protein